MKFRTISFSRKFPFLRTISLKLPHSYYFRDSFIFVKITNNCDTFPKKKTSAKILAATNISQKSAKISCNIYIFTKIVPMNRTRGQTLRNKKDLWKGLAGSIQSVHVFIVHCTKPLCGLVHIRECM